MDGLELALVVGAEPHRLAGRGAMADGTEHLVAPQHQLHRPARHPGRHDAEDLRALHQRLRAEAAAQEGRADQDVGGVQAEQLRDAALAHGEGLAGRVDDELVAVPLRHDGVRLHGVMVLGRRLVGGVEALRCAREAGLDVAAVVDVRRLADADGRRHEALVAVEADAGRLDLVLGGEQRHALGGGLQRLGDHHRDRLVGVADAIVLQHVHAEREGAVLLVRVEGERRGVARHHDVDDAGMRLGGRDVERRHAAARDRARTDGRVEQAFGMVVGREAGRAGDLENAFAPGQRLADVRAVAGMGLLRHVRRHPGARRTGRPAGRARARACRRAPA